MKPFANSRPASRRAFPLTRTSSSTVMPRVMAVGFVLGAATVAGTLAQSSGSPPVIAVTLDRQEACYLAPGDGLYDIRLFFTVAYRNSSDREEIFFDEEQAGLLWLQAPADAPADAWEFMPPRVEEPGDRTRRFVVWAGEQSHRPAQVTLTVRGPNVPSAAWPLGPGRHLFRVLVRRMRAATGDERREFSAFGFWREYLSAPIGIDLAMPESNQLCRDVSPERRP